MYPHPSTCRVLKQKKPTMSPTHPIKRSATQTMTNPIVYFRAFFTCCNEKKIKLVNHSHEVNYYYSLWVREGVIFHSVKDYREWELYRASVDPVWPGRDKLSLLVLFKAFKVTIQRAFQSVRESASVSSKLTHAWEKQHYEIAAVWCSWNF